MRKFIDALKSIVEAIKNYLKNGDVNHRIAAQLAQDVEALEQYEKLWVDALKAAVKNNAKMQSNVKENTDTESSGGKYSINEKFFKQFDNWDKKSIGFSFVIGETSQALQQAGVQKKQIRWDASKILKILNKHNGMTINIIKQIPALLEKPVIVIDSKKDSNSRVVMGDVYDEHGNIVTVILLLTPTSSKGNVLDFYKISSAEGRSHIKSLFSYDNQTLVPVRYVDKKRIHDWLNVNRLQLPLHNLDQDSNTNISQFDENVNNKFSLPETDSNGNKLSKQQREYFKDSKIVDDNGNLKVMYHGSPNSFTVFDKKKAKSGGYYGNGFYFTDSEAHANHYGNAYIVYLNITNPLQDGTYNITKEQLREFVAALAEDEDYGIENYGYNATVDSVTDSVYGKSDFAMLLDLNSGCVGNMVEAVKLFNEVTGTDYDGIVAVTETVAFYPEQIKKTDNKNPTTDKDIRFSLSEPIEEKGNLIAVHNIYTDKLIKSLKLGGFPMPSIAVTKADMGHGNYGEISFVFDKSTIDPKANKANKVYGGDAWTPTYPDIEYKVNDKTSQIKRKSLNQLLRHVMRFGAFPFIMKALKFVAKVRLLKSRF